MTRYLHIALAISLLALQPATAAAQGWMTQFCADVAACWTPAGPDEAAQATSVTVAFSLTKDGVPVAASLRLSSYDGGEDHAAKQAFASAKRAILRCGADGYNLPRDKYETWRDIEMTFNTEAKRTE